MLDRKNKQIGHRTIVPTKQKLQGGNQPEQLGVSYISREIFKVFNVKSQGEYTLDRPTGYQSSFTKSF